jgi:hypothetical protein
MRQITLTLLISAAVALAVQLWIVPQVLPAESHQPRGLEREPLELVEQRTWDLPEDAHTWHTILLVRPDWRAIPTERRVEALFHTEPSLVSLKLTRSLPSFALWSTPPPASWSNGPMAR